MPRADLARVDETRIGTGPQRIEDRLNGRDVLCATSDHQRVAVVQTPQAAGDPGVDETDALGGKRVGVRDVVGPAGVATVHDYVAGTEQVGELVDRVARRRACRDHDPYHTWRGQCSDELLDAV